MRTVRYRVNNKVDTSKNFLIGIGDFYVLVVLTILNRNINFHNIFHGNSINYNLNMEFKKKHIYILSKKMN